MKNIIREQKISLKGCLPEPEAVAAVPGAFAREYGLFPICIRNGRLIAAVDDPMKFYILDELEAMTGLEPSVVLADPGEIARAIEKTYGREAVAEAVREANAFCGRERPAPPELEEGEAAGRAPVVNMVNMLLRQAYFLEASDIHIEPSEAHVEVRFRINGDLNHYTSLNKSVGPALVTRLKIMAGMDIAEKRLPQDGKFRFRLEDEALDVRASSIPTVFGEHILLRLLNGGRILRLADLASLGMEASQMEFAESIIQASQGLLLVAGPTGSGKSTTLYAMLRRLKEKPVHIVTVEDPVEQILKGVTQVPVGGKTKVTFSSALRAVLRQDPDVIMVGEIRDEETAAMAVRAAVTGHLVLATIHTNDCASSVLRLTDMGVPAYMAAAALAGVISQRLVKILCPHCCRPCDVSEKEISLLGGRPRGRIYRACGCARCGYTGYSKRTAVYETLKIDPPLSEEIGKGITPAGIRRYQDGKGFIYMRDRLRKMVEDGKTDMQEYRKIVFSVPYRED